MIELVIAGWLALTLRPVCGADAETPLRLAALMTVNAARAEAGAATLAPHPALCQLARRRAAAVAARGAVTPDRQTLEGGTESLYRGGYRPHAWIEGTLLGAWGGSPAAQWRSTQPEWWQRVRGGDFSDVGVGLARRDGRPVLALVLALPKRTYQWRQAAPLLDLEATRQAVLEAVNAARAEAGRPPVIADPALDAAAQAHAEDMRDRDFYDHVDPDGTGPRARARAAGYRRAGALGENIAKGLLPPAEVVRRWLDSSGHRRNMLRRGAERTGIGIAVGDVEERVEAWWVQLFAGGR